MTKQPPWSESPWTVPPQVDATPQARLPTLSVEPLPPAGHSGSGMIANAATPCCWMKVEPDHPVCRRPGDKPSRPGQASQDRSSGRALHLDWLGLARSLTGGSTADGMISTTGVCGSASVGMIRNICGTIFAVSTGNSDVPRGQHANSPARDGGLRSRVRARYMPDRAVRSGQSRSLMRPTRSR
jgi:hypothetical protein